jgi:hypothetical protein
VHDERLEVSGEPPCLGVGLNKVGCGLRRGPLEGCPLVEGPTALSKQCQVLRLSQLEIETPLLRGRCGEISLWAARILNAAAGETA